MKVCLLPLGDSQLVFINDEEFLLVGGEKYEKIIYEAFPEYFDVKIHNNNDSDVIIEIEED